MVRLVPTAQREPCGGGRVPPHGDGGRRSRSAARGTGADVGAPPRRSARRGGLRRGPDQRGAADRGRRPARLVQLGRPATQRRAPSRDAPVHRRLGDQPRARSRAGDDHVHGHRRLDRARGGPRRCGLERASGAAPHARPRRARAVPRRGAGHGRRWLLRRVRRARSRDRVRVGDPRRGPRASGSSYAPACTRESASASTASSEASRFRPGRASPRSPSPARCSSPRPSRISSRARGSSSRTAARAS